MRNIVAVTFLFTLISQVEDPFYGRDYPFVHSLSKSDKTFIAALAKADEHPTWYKNDYFLKDPENHKGYIPLLVWATKKIGSVPGDYLQPFYWLGSIVTLVHLFGFFVLGRLIFKERWVAILLALASLGSPGLTRMTWGPVGFLGRGIFSALLPYLLWAGLKWRDVRWTWPVVLTGCGVLVYIHPPSGAVWAPALLLSYCSTGLRDWSGKVKWFTLSALAFLVIASSFLFSYRTGPHLRTALTPNEMEHYRESRPLVLPAPSLSARVALRSALTGNEKHSSREMLDIGRGYMLKNAFQKGILPLLLLGCGGFLLAACDVDCRTIAWWALLLAIGIAIGSIWIPLGIEAYDERTGMIPFAHDLLRGIGYLCPLVLILAMLGIDSAGKRMKQPSVLFRSPKNRLIALHVVFVLGWLVWFPPRAFSFWDKESAEALSRGQNLKEALTTIRERLPKEAVFVGYQGTRYLPWQMDDLGLFIRLYGERPLAFCYKDGIFLMVQNPRLFLSWSWRFERVRETLSKPWGLENDAARFCAYARSWGAQYWLASNLLLEDISRKGLEEAEYASFKNDHYTVVDLEMFLRAAVVKGFLPPSEVPSEAPIV